MNITNSPRKSNSTKKKIAVGMLAVMSFFAIAVAAFYSTTTVSSVSEASNRRSSYVRPVRNARNVVIRDTGNNTITNTNTCKIVGNNQTCINGVIQ